MLRKFCNKLLFSWMGWEANVTEPTPDKCILCIAPHTSNWDFLMGELYYTAIGRKSNFLIKKEWFVGPLAHLFRKLGGIPVERSKKTSLTDQLAAKAIEADLFSLAVTPEGTRSRVTKWKRGFYFIALKANLPILLYALDYKEKRIICTRTLVPSGNVEEDMKIIMDYYRNVQGRHPEKFAVEDL